MRLFKSLAGPLTVWLLAVLLLVALVGEHLYRDITVIHEMAADIQRTNAQSHRLHDLEMRVRQMVAHAHDFLITGAPEYPRKFDVVAADIRRLMAAARTDGIDFSDFEKPFDAIRAIAVVQLFELPFATGNMEGPILMQEMDAHLARLSASMTARHHEMDRSVNRSMNTASGMQLDMRDDLLVSLLLLLALLGGLTAYVYRRIVRPLVILRREVAHIGEIRFSNAFPDFGPNEIGDLSQALNAMGQAIEQYTQELAQAKSLAAHQEKMHALGLMAAGIAHEVGNPLSAASVSVEVAMCKLDRGDHGTARSYLATLKQELQRIEKIVEGILDFARSSNNQQEGIIDLHEVVRGAVNLVRLSRYGKKVDFRLSLSPDLPEARGNADMFKQVLVNLLLNAADASEADQPVSIEASLRDGAVCLDVRDEGSGIPKALQEHIFSPLFTTKARGKGTGLGLSISRDLMRRMGGELELAESSTKGSRFRICIPFFDGGRHDDSDR